MPSRQKPQTTERPINPIQSTAAWASWRPKGKVHQQDKDTDFLKTYMTCKGTLRQQIHRKGGLSEVPNFVVGSWEATYGTSKQKTTDGTNTWEANDRANTQKTQDGTNTRATHGSNTWEASDGTNTWEATFGTNNKATHGTNIWQSQGNTWNRHMGNNMRNQHTKQQHTETTLNRS